MSDTKLSYLIIISLVFALLTPFTVLAESHGDDQVEPMKTEEMEADSKVEEMETQPEIEGKMKEMEEANPEAMKQKAEEAVKEKMEKAGEKSDAMPHMSEEMMQKWTEYATPGEKHKVLQSMVGEWDYELKFWHTPDSEPEVHKGTSTIKSIMDGRFIKHKAQADMNGMPFEGMGLVGYNNELKKYQTLWIDNMGTGMMTATGQYDAEMKAIVEEGTYTCPMEEKEKSFRGITRLISENKFTYEWFTDDKDGNRYRAMEIEYKRRP